ncbi:MAG: hypothetical protein M3203_10975 [Actinomycetota bacterium]|nr:hypothetical protein [Actinomycetota bacterium]
MTLVRLLGAWFFVATVSLAVFAVKLVLDKEYAYWAPRLGALLIRLAGRFMPKRVRKARVQEWLAELDVLEQAGLHGLLFAVRLLVRSPVAGICDRRSLSAAWAPENVTLQTGRQREGSVVPLSPLRAFAYRFRRNNELKVRLIPKADGSAVAGSGGRRGEF